jgi:O-acetylhomoserine (thiol)-lyase
MMTIDLASQDHCFKFINKLKMVKRATNLFDNRSLAIHPASTIFGPLDEKTRHEMDINDTTIRLSIGLEHHDDIIEDIKQAVK